MKGLFKKKISALSDTELLERYRQDGKTAWMGELYLRYHHLVFGLCLKYLKDRENAKDAVIAVFEKLIADLKTREVSTFQHWLYTVSRNHCLETLRMREREERRRHVFHEYYEVNTTQDGELIGLKEMKEASLVDLERAIGKLNREQMECVTLFYLREKSYKEITEATGYTLGEVKSHLQNGRRMLRQLMK